MQTWHIHIGGLVQGVGFRPYVYRLANEMGIAGTVSNHSSGVHIYATATPTKLEVFYQQLIAHPPAHAIITHHEVLPVALQSFPNFSITESALQQTTDLLLTPDYALCDECRAELHNKHNHRYHYPFITCTHCGPRYSISTALPYDRRNTTMQAFTPCNTCAQEYNNAYNRRHFSQTNSCENCGIAMCMYNKDGEVVCNDTTCILLMVKDALLSGHIVAVKGIGGYLLLCDATNFFTIKLLRERKARPGKPFAVLYPNLSMAAADVEIRSVEEKELKSAAAPIVICTLLPNTTSGICTAQVAPGLNKLGVLLPYAPLLELISTAVNRPLVATSGNTSGAPIIYNDASALEYLGEIADFVLTHNREIIVPQDDSVVQFTYKTQQRIVLRRSRGLAPNFLPAHLRLEQPTIATGAEMKGSIALWQHHRCYISQYLGNQTSYDAQIAWRHTLEHLSKLLHFTPAQVVADMHPNYNCSAYARRLALAYQIPLIEVQHHEAHFAAVLAENNLLQEDRVLGVVWDGTGFGTDKNIWGGEFFLLRQKEIIRYAHLDYFPVLLGDKMAKEPRLSALALSDTHADCTRLLENKFSPQEFRYYNNLLHYRVPDLFTSSMGRMLDAIASLLQVCDVMSFEGEAAMKLEALAATCSADPVQGYPLQIFKNIVRWQPLLNGVCTDIQQGVDAALIALKVHHTLVDIIDRVAWQAGVQQIACSGGVFQNALLVDLLQTKLAHKYALHFHQQLAPNDENIALGQLASLQLKRNINVGMQAKLMPSKQLLQRSINKNLLSLL